MQHRQRPTAAFTLIELLVVIAIIGVLALLSVPVMSKAFGVAAETQCVSNLRSLAQATTTYGNDFKRRFPAGTGNRVSFANLAGAKGNGNNAANLDATRRVLNPYLGDAPEAAICPLDRGETRYDTPRFADSWGTSYVIVANDFDRFDLRLTRNGVWGLEGFGLLDVSSPGTKALMADVVLIRDLDADEQQAWHGLEDGHMRSGMSFVDGHAEALRLKELPTSSFQWPRLANRRQIESMAKTDLYY